MIGCTSVLQVVAELGNYPNSTGAASTASEPLLSVRQLTIRANYGRRYRTIVKDCTLDVWPGESVAIVGESGSGKSMTAKAITRLLPRGVTAEGRIGFQGRDLFTLSESQLARLRGSELALLFQDPFTMLNPLMPAGRHIEEGYKNGLRASRSERREFATARLREVGIRDPAVAQRYPFQLSGGMRQRVALAAALARDPKLLVADEPSTALDVTTQKEILQLLKSLRESRGMGLVLITHNLRIAFAVCDRIYVLYAGSLLEVSQTMALEREPLHPYTLGLLLAEPPIGHRAAKLEAIDGSVPSPDAVGGICPFAPRCQWAQNICWQVQPPLAEIEGGRLSACIRLPEIRNSMRGKLGEAREWATGTARSVAPAVIRVEGLKKVYERGNRPVLAVDGVTLEVGEGESVGLVGESGSGKTTVARCLVGLETPTAGSVVIDGEDVSDYQSINRAQRRRVRRTIQMIFQDPYSTLNPSLTIGSTLKAALRARAVMVSHVDREVQRLLASVGLPAAYMSRKPVALSGGERQRVAIARVLAVEPKVIVCDEPVSALDVSVQAQVLSLFRSLRENFGLSYLFITHDLAVVRQIVERVYVMYQGKIVESGPVDEILDEPSHPYTKRLVASVPRSDAGWLAGDAAGDS